MAAQKDHDMGPPLPKFGEWDVNNPTSAEGFTVIFSKASNDKKTNNAPSNVRSPHNGTLLQSVYWGLFEGEEFYDPQLCIECRRKERRR